MAKQTLTHKFSRERVEKVARIYSSSRDAGLALGCSPNAFGRMCRAYGILTPAARRKVADMERRQAQEEGR